MLESTNRSSENDEAARFVASACGRVWTYQSQQRALQDVDVGNVERTDVSATSLVRNGGQPTFVSGALAL